MACVGALVRGAWIDCGREIARFCALLCLLSLFARAQGIARLPEFAGSGPAPRIRRSKQRRPTAPNGGKIDPADHIRSLRSVIAAVCTMVASDGAELLLVRVLDRRLRLLIGAFALSTCAVSVCLCLRVAAVFVVLDRLHVMVGCCDVMCRRQVMVFARRMVLGVRHDALLQRS